MTFAGLLRRAIGKPLPVIAFRLLQSLRLQALHRSGGWPRIARRAEKTFRDRTIRSARPVLVHPHAPPLTDGQRPTLDAVAASVRNSDFKIFGAPVPNLDDCDFSTDSRFGKTRPGRYSKLNRFSEAKDIAYDVTSPWELSRIQHLVPRLAR